MLTVESQLAIIKSIEAQAKRQPHPNGIKSLKTNSTNNRAARERN
jgi:hypothetical protein